MILDLIEKLKVPTNAALVLCGIFLVSQVIGELLELKGKVVPEIMKIRKRFARRKKERELISSLSDMADTLKEVKQTLSEVNAHYSADNITMRDKWIESVNKRLNDNDQWMQKLDSKLDQNNEDTLSLVIEWKRNAIIDFAAYVINESNPVTREQYTRIFKIHEEYEAKIAAHGMKNGEVDIAYRIITESYEQHMRNHTFVENLRGYES